MAPLNPQLPRAQTRTRLLTAQNTQETDPSRSVGMPAFVPLAAGTGSPYPALLLHISVSFHPIAVNSHCKPCLPSIPHSRLGSSHIRRMQFSCSTDSTFTETSTLTGYDYTRRRVSNLLARSATTKTPFRRSHGRTALQRRRQGHRQKRGSRHKRVLHIGTTINMNTKAVTGLHDPVKPIST